MISNEMGGKIIDDFPGRFEADAVGLFGQFFRCHLGDGFDGTKLLKKLLAAVFTDSGNVRKQRG